VAHRAGAGDEAVRPMNVLAPVAMTTPRIRPADHAGIGFVADLLGDGKRSPVRAAWSIWT
jgi:hypothetical protein